MPPPQSTPSEISASEDTPELITVVAGGDVLIHPPLTQQARRDGDGSPNFTPILSGIGPVIESADLALCHLEVPLAEPEGPFLGYPLFSAPPQLARSLASIGYDSCSTASNHTFDQGEEGVINTLDVMDQEGLAHTGSARTEREANRPLILDANGVRIGHLSYTFAFNSGTTAPADAPWMANLLDVEEILADARAARTAGAELVIVSLHWGIEDQHEPTPEQRDIARLLLNRPAVDLIIGHHAHVVQPFERINGKWVAYGLGNQIARHEQPRGTTEEGVLARFTFSEGPRGWRVEFAEYLPTLIDVTPPIRLRYLTTDREIGSDRRALALDRIDQVVNSLGAAETGLTRPTG